MWRRQRLTRDRIHYEVAGRGDPVVLIHGLGASTRWWQNVIPALEPRFRVFTIDLIGFGASRGRFVLDRAARQLAHWMESNGLARAHVIGHSMGGYIAA